MKCCSLLSFFSSSSSPDFAFEPETAAATSTTRAVVPIVCMLSRVVGSSVVGVRCATTPKIAPVGAFIGLAFLDHSIQQAFRAWAPDANPQERARKQNLVP